MREEPTYLVIPAAGLGTRMRTVNPDVPKEMLIIGKKPAIQYAVEEGLSAGIKNIVIVINRKKEVIRRYFEDRTFREKIYPSTDAEADDIHSKCKIIFLYQDDPVGEADSIDLASSVVGGQALAIIYPDNIYCPAPGALQILKSVFDRYSHDVAALMTVTDENAEGIGNSGRVTLQPVDQNIYRIEKFHPKGHGHFIPRFKGELRTCGIAIYGSHLFRYIKSARTYWNEGEFTDSFVRDLMLKEKVLLGCRLPGNVFDIGNPKGYELCQKYFDASRNS
jgi:UTP--glucose-1-phosphate uridylyltransferase